MRQFIPQDIEWILSYVKDRFDKAISRRQAAHIMERIPSCGVESVCDWLKCQMIKMSLLPCGFNSDLRTSVHYKLHFGYRWTFGALPLFDSSVFQGRYKHTPAFKSDTLRYGRGVDDASLGIRSVVKRGIN